MLQYLAHTNEFRDMHQLHTHLPPVELPTNSSTSRLLPPPLSLSRYPYRARAPSLLPCLCLCLADPRLNFWTFFKHSFLCLRMTGGGGGFRKGRWQCTRRTRKDDEDEVPEKDGEWRVSENESQLASPFNHVKPLRNHWDRCDYSAIVCVCECVLRLILTNINTHALINTHTYTCIHLADGSRWKFLCFFCVSIFALICFQVWILCAISLFSLHFSFPKQAMQDKRNGIQ